MVAVETRNSVGDRRLGTAFHIGEGVYATARHVVEGELLRVFNANAGDGTVVRGPHFHPEAAVDVACFRLAQAWPDWITLGGHLDE